MEARGEIAVRGSILDVYPSTDDHPVRIDLWGDEVERLSGFSVADQRSTRDLAEVVVFPARELLPDARGPGPGRGAGRGARRGVASSGSASPRAQTFDGMESWLPWLTPDEHLLPDLLPPTASVLLVEPRRMRDRAGELRDDEAALAEALAPTWGATAADDVARLSLDFERLLEHTKARAVSIVNAPESPGTPHLVASAFDPVVGDVDGLAQRLRSLRARRGARSILAADGRGSADRLRDVLADAGVDAGIEIVVAPLERGVVVPGAGIALVAEADLTGRRRVHRRARGARKGADFYDDLKPGDYVVHHQHGVGRYGGMVDARDRWCRARLHAPGVQGRRQALHPDRPGRLGAALHRRRQPRAQPARWRRVAEDAVARARRGAGDRGRARGAVPPTARDPGSRVPRRHAVAARDRGGVPLRGDARPARRDRGGEGRHGAVDPDGPARVRRRRVRQDRGRGAGRRSRRCRTASRSRSWRRRRCSRTSTARRSGSASRTTRCASRCSPAS